MKQTPLTYKGSSSDRRTNKWEVKCPMCGTKFKPMTTLMSESWEECPHCMIKINCKYNDEPPVAVVL